MAKFINTLHIKSRPEILKMMSNGSFYDSMSASEATSLKPILSDESLKLEQPIRISIMALLILKFPDILTQQDHRAYSEYLTRLLKTSNYKNVIAGLLVQIPHFSSFKSVLPHLEPHLVSEQKMLEINPKLKQSSATQYERQVQRHRVAWPRLAAHIPLTLTTLLTLQQKISDLTTNSLCILAQIEQETNFIMEKVRLLDCNRIDIDKLTTDLEKLISQQGIHDQTEEQTTVRNTLTLSAVKILQRLLKRLERKFIRKLHWLLTIQEYLLASTNPELLTSGLQLTSIIFSIFGMLDLHNILFSNTSGLIHLLTLLFRRKTESAYKQEMHYYKQKNKKKVQKVQLNLSKSQSPFSNLVSSLSIQQQRQLVLLILQLFYHYYSQPHTTENVATLLDLIDMNQNKLTKQTMTTYEQIKKCVFPQNVIFSRDVENIYQQLCQKRTKRRQKSNHIEKTLELKVFPTVEVLPASKVPPIKKATSQDLQNGEHMEGWTQKKQWSSIKVSNRNESEPSEMFYSFHESRFSKEKEDPPERKEPNEDDFILTPSFQ